MAALSNLVADYSRGEPPAVVYLISAGLAWFRVKETSALPAPGNGGDSGLAWAEGTLWVGQYQNRKVHQIDPKTGAILRTIESNRFVTGVTWVDGELWHATLEANESDLRRIDPQRERFSMRSKWRGECSFRATNPMDVSSSSAEVKRAGK